MYSSFGEDEHCLTRWARNKINEGEVNEIVASSLLEEIMPDSLKVFVEVAERCLHHEPKKRPTMAQEQQEIGKTVGPNLVAPASKDDCPSNGNTMSSAKTEQSEEASADVHADTSPYIRTNKFISFPSWTR